MTYRLFYKQKGILIVNIIKFNYLNLKNKHNEKVNNMDIGNFDGVNLYGFALCSDIVYEKHD